MLQTIQKKVFILINERNYIIKYSKCLLKLNSYALRPTEPKIPQTQVKLKLKFKKALIFNKQKITLIQNRLWIQECACDVIESDKKT
jgi:hypothetical protein